jgi:hypothetical protein
MNTLPVPAANLIRCRACGEHKPADDYYVHRKAGVVVDERCKPCTRARALAHRNANLDESRARERARRKVAADRAGRVRRASKESYERTRPVKEMARSLVSRAIASGKLVKQPCELCGGAAHAHHDDYGKPLDVRWLCPTHHSEWHSFNVAKCPEPENEP